MCSNDRRARSRGLLALLAAVALSGGACRFEPSNPEGTAAAPDRRKQTQGGASGKRSVGRSSVRRAQGTEIITFDDLKLEMPVDAKFDEKLLTERVKELDGRRVAIKGFIYAAGIFQQTGIRQFPLVKNTQCKFGPGGRAYCVILVKLKPGVTTDFTLRPVTVEGTLHVDPFEGPDGNTWAVYRMVGDRVRPG